MDQHKKVTSPWAKTGRSGIHSRGLFAKKNIPEGTRVIEYVGEKVTKAESDRRAHTPLERHKKNTRHGAVYIFELNKRHDIDGNVWYNTARFANHSCDPNCETEIVRGRIWILSIKAIKKGEEITYNYGYSYEDHEEHYCRCGADNCMGFILAEEHWPKLRRKHARQKKQRSV